jgi:hypothetical protein
MFVMDFLFLRHGRDGDSATLRAVEGSEVAAIEIAPLHSDNVVEG